MSSITPPPGGLPPANVTLPNESSAAGEAVSRPSKTAKAAAKAAMAGEALSTDPTFTANSGLIGEKRKTGQAALATPPPLPPGAPTITSETLKQFKQLSDDYQAGLSKGAPTNQPSIRALGQQLNAIDTSTPAGQAQATKVNAQLTHATLNALDSTSSGGNLGAFLLLAMGSQTKQRDAESKLLDVTSMGQKTMLEQQRAQHEEQAKQLKKAADKQAKFAFLKPLMAIFTVLLAVVCAPSAAMLAITLAGSLAGFLAGGVISGKKNGTGFDFMGALEGASMGAAAGGVAAILKAALTKLTTTLAPKLISEASQTAKGAATKSEQALASGASTTSQSTQVASMMRNAVTRQWEEAMADVRKTQQKVFKDKLASNADRAKTDANADAAGASKAAPSAKSAPQDGGKAVAEVAGKRDRIQTIVNQVGTGVGNTAQTIVDTNVNVDTAKGQKAEAEAKLTQTFIDQYKMLYEGAMDSSQSLIQMRKNSSDLAMDLIRSHADTNKSIISGFGKG